MIRRHVVTLALALPLLSLACAATTDDSVETTSDSAESALSGANGTTYVLTSFDGTTQFMGLNNQGKTFKASYAASTDFKLAVLDKFQPVDPCRTAAVAYNNYVAVNDTVGFNTTLTSMATGSCKAKVLLDKNNFIKAFQPAP